MSYARKKRLAVQLAPIPGETVVSAGKEEHTRPAQFSPQGGNGAVRVCSDAVALCQMSYARKQRPLRRDIYFTTKQGFVKGLFSHFYAGRGVVYAVPACYNCKNKGGEAYDIYD